MTTTATPVLEVAVFTVRAPHLFAEVQLRTHEALSTLPGHRKGLRLRGRTEGLFADLVAWESHEAAERASAQVRDDPRFAPLMTSIDALRLYAHYQLTPDIGSLLDDLRRAPLVEVAAYGVRDVTAHVRLHPQVHEALRAQPGYRGGAPARQVEDPGHFADLIGWDRDDDHHHAGATLQARPELAGFFSGFGEMKVFELFTVLG